MTYHWLAFDIGTTGAKAAIIDAQLRTVQSVTQHYATQSADGGIVEQNADDWWQAAVAAAQQLDLTQVEAIALTGQMQDVILIDAAGKPVRPVILYSDSRAQTEINRILAQMNSETLYQLTGNEQTASSLLAKCLWLHHHEPESLEKSHYLLMSGADFIAYQMTHVAVSDTTTASTTGLLDLEKRQWLTNDIFAAIGLNEIIRLLPPVKSGGTQVGTLTANAAHPLGLKSGIPVYHGPGDAGAATLGVGSGELGKPYGYVGTSGWVGYTSWQRGKPETGVFTLAHPKNEHVMCVAPILTAGGNLDWAKTALRYDTHEQMILEALQREPSHLLYLPYLNGERSPFSDPLARGTFIGLNSRHTTADLARAVLEGVALAYRHALEALLTVPVDTLTLTGGGTRTEAWCQLFADITQKPVAIAEDAENVGVRGAVLAAQVATGLYDHFSPQGAFPVSKTQLPNPQIQQHYDQQYALFRDSYSALRNIFSRMQDSL
jgi:xylulokinase